MEYSPIAAADSKRDKRRISPTVYLIVLFWIGQYSFLTLSRNLSDMKMDDNWVNLVVRAVMACIGIAISFGIDRLHRSGGERSWAKRVWIAVGAAVCGAALHSFLNFNLFQLAKPEQNMESFSIASYAEALLAWLWTYSAISALLLAGAYSDALRERERRLAEWQGLAHLAQMRALRYQLNPHFMFNTLNSIASLISAGKPAPAEQMVENLSDFLRAGLALDPSDDLVLEREFELQSLYLSIESIRFADRLCVKMDLPEDLRDALVPSLILQPLVENAVKHGVSRSDSPVTIAIGAARVGERLALTVRNGVPDTADRSAGGGMGIGLANVARRLELRYGEACEFNAGFENGHFAVRFSIPIRRGA